MFTIKEPHEVIIQENDNPINRDTLSSATVAHVKKLIDPFQY